MVLETNNSLFEVYDPYNSKNSYKNNSVKRMEDKHLSDVSMMWITRRCKDLESGRNLTGKKRGKPRSYRYINTHQQKIVRLAMIGEEQYKKSIIDLTSDEIGDILEDMKSNKIKKLRQKNGNMLYTAVDNFAVHYKAFWHWYMKYKKKVDKEIIEDITDDLDISNDRDPEFVYFKLDSLKRLAEEAKYHYKVLMYFLFDSGMRVTEAMNIKKNDFSEDKKSGKLQVEIRNETSKTFGRKIKLMLSSDIIREYLKKGDFKHNVYIMKIAKPKYINEYLKRLAKRIWGEKYEKLTENNSHKTLSMYDFRHSSGCYWLVRYKSESVLKWRFGWKSSSMIHYYTKFLGMMDTISEDDMMIDTTKTDLEKQLHIEQQERIIMEERLKKMESLIANLALKEGLK